MSKLLLLQRLCRSAFWRQRRPHFEVWLGLIHRFMKMSYEPRMCPDLFLGVSGFRICVQYFWNKIFRLAIHKTWYRVLTLEYFLVKLARIRIFKRQIPTDHGVQDHSTWPDVHLEAMILLARYHFWSSITRASTGCLKLRSWFVQIWEAKVDNFQHAWFTLKEEVLWLKIPVNDAITMEMPDS